jgi:ferric-dicitrate binding protein FerR (iron transport regulator)
LLDQTADKPQNSHRILERAHMNRYFRLLALTAFIASVVIGRASAARAASLNEVRITRVNNHVQLLHPMAAARLASVNDSVDEDTIVRTGKDSRAELTFPDQTVVRLAANTSFSFKNGTHDLNLAEGAVLIESPKGSNGATIHAATVAAAITGTASMLEYRPGVYKFLVVEGTGRLYRPGHLGDSVLVGPGQLVMGNPNAAVSDPVDFDIARFMKTSRFIVDLPPLRSEKLIAAESQKQQQAKSKKTLIDTNLVIFGGGTRVSVLGQAQTNVAGRITAAPAPSHSSPETTGAAQQ